MSNALPEEKSRNEPFTKNVKTTIWREEPTKYNPYLCDTAYCHGYEHTELTTQCSFAQNIYLLFKGELPNTEQLQLFEQTLNAFINPGPRHGATRAAMNASLGRSPVGNILPVGLTTLSGEHLGSYDVELAMKLLRDQVPNDIDTIEEAVDAFIEKLISQISHEIHTVLTASPADKEQDDALTRHLFTELKTIHIPGFGSRFGDIDAYALKLFKLLFKTRQGSKYFLWCKHLHQQLSTLEQRVSFKRLLKLRQQFITHKIAQYKRLEQQHQTQITEINQDISKIQQQLLNNCDLKQIQSLTQQLSLLNNQLRYQQLKPWDIQQLQKSLKDQVNFNQGLMLTGTAGAAFMELGFNPKQGAGLFQLAACPGLLAHGLEMCSQPITALPFVPDQNYAYYGGYLNEE